MIKEGLDLRGMRLGHGQTDIRLTKDWTPSHMIFFDSSWKPSSVISSVRVCGNAAAANRVSMIRIIINHSIKDSDPKHMKKCPFGLCRRIIKRIKSLVAAWGGRLSGHHSIQPNAAKRSQTRQPTFAAQVEDPEAKRDVLRKFSNTKEKKRKEKDTIGTGSNG